MLMFTSNNKRDETLRHVLVYINVCTTTASNSILHAAFVGKDCGL